MGENCHVKPPKAKLWNQGQSVSVFKNYELF